jgi:hypothetical protein
MEVEPQETDILQWWKSKEAQLPNLARMAMFIHAIPGTAVPSERTNSEGREMLPYTRNRLGSDMVEATLVSKSYLRNKRLSSYISLSLRSLT